MYRSFRASAVPASVNLKDNLIAFFRKRSLELFILCWARRYWPR